MSRFMLRRAASAAVVSTVALGLLFGACGGDDDDGGDDSANQALIDAMVAEGATEEQARCFIDELGDDAERLYGADEDELSEDDLQDVLEALQDCGAFDEE